MRLIDADARMEDIEQYHCVGCSKYGDAKKCKKCWVADAMWALKHADTVEAVPVVHGQWESDCIDSWVCSACGTKQCILDATPEELGYNFCPHCGTKMDLEADHGKENM